MSPTAPRSANGASATKPVSRTRARFADIRPFAGLIEPALVEEPVDFSFDGSIARAHAASVWVWMARDLAADEIDFARIEDGSLSADELEPLLPQLLARVGDAVGAVQGDFDASRRLRAQVGGDDVLERLPFVIGALRNRALLVKAQAFGKALNAIPDEAGLIPVLQSMPIKDKMAAAFLMHAALGQIANPSRLAAAAMKLSGSSAEAAIARAGFAPLIDAMLAHAQNQLQFIQPIGPFADIDLVCRALERFHRLVRAIASHLELERASRWSTVLGALTKKVSERMAPRLKEVVPDMNGALRRVREGNDRSDPDRLLAALNGVYLLATLRDCKDSLALNALFEQAWTQSGEVLEMHLNRNLEMLRANPADTIVAARLDTGIKMAEVRFNPEYAETLRRATAMRR